GKMIAIRSGEAMNRPLDARPTFMHRSGRQRCFKPRDRRVPLMLVAGCTPLFMGLEVKRQLQKKWRARAILVETGIEEAAVPPGSAGGCGQDFLHHKQDRKDREDFTDRCVVSIDPARPEIWTTLCTSNPMETVGVHIADVSHFVRQSRRSTREARRRSTSVYLVQRVIPMAAEALSNGYCSLHPGEEKLAFSVIFQIGAQRRRAELPSIIISPAGRLSYEERRADAQLGRVPPSECPALSPFSGRQVRTNSAASCISWAKKFRKERLSKAALASFTRCRTGTVSTACRQLMKEEDAEWSHQLVEEWMLKANVAAAETLVKEAPDVALLRRHPPPRDPRAGLAGDSGGRLPAAAGSPGNNNLAASSTEIMLKLNDFLAEQSDDPQFRSFRQPPLAASCRCPWPSTSAPATTQIGTLGGLSLEVPSVHAFHFAYTSIRRLAGSSTAGRSAAACSSPDDAAAAAAAAAEQQQAARSGGWKPRPCGQQVRIQRQASVPNAARQLLLMRPSCAQPGQARASGVCQVCRPPRHGGLGSLLA
uniref:RNB domain-containing protein n=1 Tax=Macrostomum lignano TaxID=282301 RepID=A0A1I8FR86_9PLAT